MTMSPREPRTGLLLALCLLVVACVYAPSLEGPFLWDDRHLVSDSDALRSSGVFSWFQRPFWLGPPGQADSTAYYRPLTSLSFALDFAVHGENSTGFHATSLLLHLACAAALFSLLRRRGVAPTLTFLLTAAWALLPRLSEAVAWISGRGDALAALFTFAALLVHRPASRPRLAAAVVLAFAALLAKESGAAALVALVILEIGEGRRERSGGWLRAGLLAAPFVGYVALRLSAGANPLSGNAGPRPVSVTLSLEALGRYAAMLVDPWRPRSLIGQVLRTDWLFVACGVGVVVALLGWAWRGARPSRDVASAVALVGVPLVMVMHLTPLPVTVVASDRYLYLPTAGLLLAVAGAVQARVARWRWLPTALLALVVTSGVRTFQRASDYAEEARFWSQAVTHSPWATTGYVELAAVAYRAGLFEDGLRLSRRAIPLDVLGSGQALDNAALMAMTSGDRDLAARLGDELVRSYPRRPHFRLRRAAIALNAKDFETARLHGEEARRLLPSYLQAQRLLRLVAESEMAVRSPVAPAVALRLDAEALRYDAVEARLRATLDEPSPDKAVAAGAVEFMIAQGPPDVARALFAKYRERLGAAGTDAAEAALEERSQRARAVHARILALESSPR